MLRAVELTVRSSTTITSLDAVSARGVTFGAPAYASQPAKIDGDPNYYDGGVFRGTRPPEHVPDAAFSPIQVLNWKHRKDLVGATLAPGRYYLFQTVRVPKAGGSVASWVFRWSAPDGTSGTTPWGQADRYAAHCRG